MRFLVLLIMLFSLAFAQKELNIYTWGDYMNPAVVQEFEKQYGVKVKLTYFESNEELLKTMRRGGTSRFDIAVPSDFIVPSMIKSGLIQPLDKGQLTNLKNLDPRFTNLPFDPNGNYSVGYLWGSIGLMYNAQKFKTPPQSWSVILDPKQQKVPFSLMDSKREMMGIGLRYMGKSVNTENISLLWQVTNSLIEARKGKYFVGFKDGVSAARFISSGRIDLAVVYNQDALHVISENPGLGFTIPKEGSTLYIDNFVIPSKAPNPTLAHTFINFMLEAKIAAKNAEYLSGATPNLAAKAFIKPEMLRNPAIWPTDEQMKGLEFILDRANDSMIAELWNQIKNAE